MQGFFYWKQNSPFYIYQYMLELTKGQEGQIIVTLNELKTIDAPYYLFVFTHTTTSDVVKFIKSSSDDESEYPERYNLFTINSSLFDGFLDGEWHYTVYEQESSTNEDISLARAVENGKLKLNPEEEFEYIKYNQTQTYKSYNG